MWDGNLMHDSLLEIEPNIFSDLERVQLEMAFIEKNPSEECVFCGKNEEMATKEVTSDQLRRPIELPICGNCNELIGEKKVEEYLIEVEKGHSSLWSQMIVNNIRKTNWMSRMVFAQLKSEKKKGIK
jgi:uncharacterized protein YlaI